MFPAQWPHHHHGSTLKTHSQALHIIPQWNRQISSDHLTNICCVHPKMSLRLLFSPCDFLFPLEHKRRNSDLYPVIINGAFKLQKTAVKKSLKVIFFHMYDEIFLTQSYRMASEVCFCVLFQAPSPIYVCKSTTSTFSFCFRRKGLEQWQNDACFICARCAFKARGGTRRPLGVCKEFIGRPPIIMLHVSLRS